MWMGSSPWLPPVIISPNRNLGLQGYETSTFLWLKGDIHFNHHQFKSLQGHGTVDAWPLRFVREMAKKASPCVSLQPLYIAQRLESLGIWYGRICLEICMWVEYLSICVYCILLYLHLSALHLSLAFFLSAVCFFALLIWNILPSWMDVSSIQVYHAPCPPTPSSPKSILPAINPQKIPLKSCGLHHHVKHQTSNPSNPSSVQLSLRIAKAKGTTRWSHDFELRQA